MYDEEIEKAVLFYTIFENQSSNIAEEDFIIPIHQKIIKAVNELKIEKEEITILTVNNKIVDNSAQTLEYIANLGNYISNMSFNTAYQLLKKYTKKRQIFNLAKQIQMEVRDEEEIDVYAEKTISKIQKIEFQTEKENNFTEQISTVLELIEKNLNKKEDHSLYTGFFDLDAITDGLHNGELTVIGARPGVGKTTFSLQIAERIASRGKTVAYVSLEMSEIQIIQKLISKKARVNSRKIRNASLNDEEIERVGLASQQISTLSFNILTKANTIQQIEIEARRLKNKNKLDLLVIDYLQLVRNTGNFKSREQEVADISRTLKLLSLELDIPIIALCQLNRNASKNEPTLADIRESGAIEQDADNVIFLYQLNPDNNIVTVDLQKQRAGNIGTLMLKFNKMNSEFLNVER